MCMIYVFYLHFTCQNLLIHVFNLMYMYCMCVVCVLHMYYACILHVFILKRIICIIFSITLFLCI